MSQRRWFVRRHVGHSTRVVVLPDDTPTNRTLDDRGPSARGKPRRSALEWRVCPACGSDARFDRRNATYLPHERESPTRQCRGIPSPRG